MACFGHEQVRARIDRVELERALRKADRLRRIAVGQRARHAQQRGAVFGIRLQRLLERARRVLVVVLLDEQIAPLGIDRAASVGASAMASRKYAWASSNLPERPRRARRAQEVARRRRAGIAHQDQLQRAARLGPPAQDQLQQAGLERRIATRVGRGHRLQERFGSRVVAARGNRPRAQDGERLVRREGLRQLLDVIEPARSPRLLGGRACRAHILRLLSRDVRRESGGEHQCDEQ